MANAKRQKPAALVERELHVAEGIACVIVAQEGLGPVRHPMHRPPEFARGDQNGDVFRVRSGFQAERAADVFRNDAQTRVGHAENGSKPVAQGPRALGAAAQEIAVARRIVGCGRTPRLHGRDHDSLVHDRDTPDMPGGGKNALDLLRVRIGIRSEARPIDGDVAGSLRPYLRRAGAHGFAQIDDRRALLIFHIDELGAVLRSLERLTDDHRDRLSKVPHRGCCQRRALRNNQLRAAAPAERRMLGYVADPLHVGASEHGEHAGRRAGRAGLDGADVGERMRRADEISIGLAADRHIVGEVAEAAHQRIILQAWLVERACLVRLGIHLGFRMERVGGKRFYATAAWNACLVTPLCVPRRARAAALPALAAWRKGRAPWSTSADCALRRPSRLASAGRARSG